MQSGICIYRQYKLTTLATLLVVLLSCSRAAPVWASEATDSVFNNTLRPKIALVLSGGGARGFAHIGVLKKIEELRIPIDIVVGTSMGSIVGGLYAIGLSPDEIENGVRSIDWEQVFNDFAKRDFRSFRRKTDDYLFTSANRVGVSRDGVKLSPGLIEGQQIELALDRLAYPGFHITDFDELHIPFRAIATDIETGDAIVLGEGNLAKAMRASMSIPAALPPVKHEGKLLVDGGIGNNIPIDVARDMGADIFIVVDVSAPLADQEDLESSIGITSQLTTILTRRVADQQLQSLTDGDVVIVPGREDLGSSSFLEYAQLIQAGLEAAEEKHQQLQTLSLTAGQYRIYKSGLPVVARRKPVIDFIEIKNQTRLQDDILALIISQTIGEPLDVLQLERDLQVIYGLDLSSSVVYGLEERDGKTGLIVYIRKREWAPTYLNLGFTLRSEFEVGSTATIDLVYTNPTINSLGGEFRATVAGGSEPRLMLDVYQPLDKRFNYFVTGDAGFVSYIFPITDNSNNVDLLQRFERSFVSLAAGRIFRQNTELRLSLFRADGHTETLVGLQPATDPDFDEGGYKIRLLHDTLDNVDFPRSGAHGRLEWSANREDLGADFDYDQVRFSLAGAGTWRRYTVFGRSIIETTLDENAPNNALFRHGGFLNLSGFLNRQLAGQHFGLLEAAFYRRLGNITLLPMYAGFSLETGNVWDDRDQISVDNTVLAGSVFVGANTILGPLYVACGLNDADSSTIYLYLGRQWSID
ncbi:MAG: patatin [Gammaproteobacteria bacterium]|nr:patatin [Gammaproteobacteria bacterium]